MSFIRPFWSFLFLILLVPSASAADFPIRITGVRVGLPPGLFSKIVNEDGQPQHLFKSGKEAPIWIDYEVLSPLPPETRVEFVVETPDGEDLLLSEKIVISASDLASQIRPILKMGGVKTEVSVRIYEEGSRKQLASPYRTKVHGLSNGRYLAFGIGSEWKGFRLPKNEATAAESQGDTTESLRHGWVELATSLDIDSWWHLDTIAKSNQKPIPFQAADVAIVATGNAERWPERKDYPGQEELIRWVEQGGQVILSVGRGVDTLNRMPLKKLLPVQLQNTTEVASVPIVLPTTPRIAIGAGNQKTIPIAQFAARKDRWHLVRLYADDAVNPLPLVVQGSYGLGRVTVVLFDLDSPPVENWKYREALWDWLLNLSGPKLPSGTDRLVDNQIAEKEDQYRDLLHTNLDTFEGVPVISFGWVALLILAYLLLIGPIERYLLRRFLKRLEWTWLTFPLIVIAVCGLIYQAAQDYKGHEIKINKIDLIDVDLQSNIGFGRSWFTIFSPQNEHYDIALESTNNQPAFVSWSGPIRNSQLTMFRRSYNENLAGAGLEGVPIQTWSTKQFGAHWAVSNPSQTLFTTTLQIADGDPSQIVGSITSNFPALITDGQLIYREKITPVPQLLPGATRYVATGSQAGSATAWLLNASEFKDPAGSKIGKTRPGENEVFPTFRLWPIMQQELMLGQFARLQNASFRELDQSWRVTDKSSYQAILLARIGTTEDSAENMNRNPANPMRIKLNDSLTFPGTIRQETYIRVLIPLQPAQRPER